MAHKFAELAFTPTIRQLQADYGSRDSYARMDEGEDYNNILGPREVEFIAARDSFYMASVSETGWPYVQHRGGAVGFVKILNEQTIGFADYSGNRQYVSAGNVANNDRVALFFMDYPNRRRLKMLGRLVMSDASDHALVDQVQDVDYPAHVERIATIRVEAFDWNCPQHITPRYSEVEFGARMAQLESEALAVEAKVSGPGGASSEPDTVFGSGPLELVVTGMRQLTPRIRAYELRGVDGAVLPHITPGSHLLVPLKMQDGTLAERHYSIASNPSALGAWEIAVQYEHDGEGGSRTLHQTWQLGTRFKTVLPVNHFALHEDARPAVLIAGGIGITPIKAMAHSLLARGNEFTLHFAGRSELDMAYREELAEALPAHVRFASSADGQRLQLEKIFAGAQSDAVFYVCGPDRLVTAAMHVARAQNLAPARIQIERFE